MTTMSKPRTGVSRSRARGLFTAIQAVGWLIVANVRRSVRRPNSVSSALRGARPSHPTAHRPPPLNSHPA